MVDDSWCVGVGVGVGGGGVGGSGVGGGGDCYTLGSIDALIHRSKYPI